MVDAPVSGGVGGAEAGTLTFMVGGRCVVVVCRAPHSAHKLVDHMWVCMCVDNGCHSSENFEAARPLLENMGANIVHCGDSGTGTRDRLTSLDYYHSDSLAVMWLWHGRRSGSQAVQQSHPRHLDGRGFGGACGVERQHAFGCSRHFCGWNDVGQAMNVGVRLGIDPKTLAGIVNTCVGGVHGLWRCQRR